MFLTLKKIFSPIKYAKWSYFGYMFGEFFDGFQSVFVIQIVALIVAAIEHKDIPWVWYGILLFIVFRIAAISIWFFTSTIIRDKAIYTIEWKLYEKYLWTYVELDNNKIESLGTGKSISIITRWLSDRINILFWTLSDVIVNAFSIVYAFALIFNQVSVWFFSIFICLFVLWVLIFSLSNKYTRKYKEEIRDMNNEFSKNTVKIIQSKFEIFQTNKIQHELEKIRTFYKKLTSLWIKNDIKGRLFEQIVIILLDAMEVCIYIFVGIGVVKWKFTFSQFVLISWLVRVVSQYTWQFQWFIKQYGRQILQIEKLWETFEETPLIRQIGNTKKFNFSNGNISIKNISFGYLEDKLFKNFSLDIVWGKKTAIVWPSWSGKTTLIKLIAWYLYPNKGDILIDEHKLSKLDLQTYYKHIWYLTQEPSVFDWTLYENLVYALDVNPTQQTLDEIIISAKCEFIYDFKFWLETEIGERGVRLSWGQKQRLAIAKIMLKNPNIVLLDEPTSALDSMSEQLISEALKNLFHKRTVIVVAHRLQTVKEADEIIVLDQGKIIQRGTHNILSKQKGIYKTMLDLQTTF